MRGNRPHRVDLNQKEIVHGLEQIPGVSVRLTHMVGRGFPDICVGYRYENHLFEIKKDPDEPLTKPEQKFHESWKGEVHVISELDEALVFLGIHPRMETE